MTIVSKSIKKNAIFNLIRQACAVLFPLITFSYASHILGNSNIGAYSFAQSIISYISMIASLGITTYAVREGTFYRDNKDAFQKFGQEIYSINIVTTIFAFILLGIIAVAWYQISEYISLIWILSINVLLTTLGADWVNIIYEDFKYISVRYIFFQVISVIALFLFVKNENDLVVYTIISVLASSGGLLFNIFYIRRYVKLRFTYNMNFKKHIVPLLLLFGSNIAVIIYVNSDISIITLLLNDAEAGIYAASTKIFQAVKHTVFAIITVMIPRFSYYVTHELFEERDKLLTKTVEILLMILLPSVVGLCLQSYNILFIFSGESYCTGNISICILSLAIPFAVASNIFESAALIPLKKDKIVLMLSVIACCLNVFINFLVIPIWGIEGAAFTTLLAEFVNGVGSYLYSKKYIKFSLNKRNLITEIIGCIFVIITCLMMSIFISNIYTQFLLSVLFSIIIYFLVLQLTGNSVFILIIEDSLSYIKNVLRR